MAEIRMGVTVSLDEAADMVQHVGPTLSYIFQGEMGIGKSYILNVLSKRMPDYRCVYAQLPTFDVGDVTGVPYTEVVNGMKVTNFAPNSLLNLQSDKPVIFMADEIGKAARPVQNSMLRLLDELKVGEYSLPEGSICFATTNLAAEGLGDRVQEHALNRCSFVTIRKPTVDQWIPWAMSNGVHPIVIAWVKKFPHCLDSYMDGYEGNLYIFYPGKTTRPFVSPRSLKKASNVMWTRGLIGENATHASIAGCVGEAAATDIMSFAQTNDRLPSWDLVIADPENALVPAVGDFAASFVTVFSAISLVTKQTLTPFMTYCKRLPKEYQGVFALNLLASPKRAIAIENRGFITWCSSNAWMI